jgi:MoaA/NifB/PqqE/SkfB family radical SAM enzyme
MAPFVQLQTDTEGNTSPCAVLDGIWKNKEDPWQHNELEDMRHNHANNIKDSRCNTCWKKEELGFESYRERFNSNHRFNVAEALMSIEDGSYKQGPKILYLKNGNVCNLQCRICGPKDSFAWSREAKHYKQEHANEMPGTMFDIENYKKNWTPKQLENLMKYNHTILRVDNFGGEALTNPKVLEYLDKLVKAGVSQNITLYFNTNASTVPNEKWWTTLSKFKVLDFQLSLDGVKEQFEYQRYPAKWKDIEDFRKWIYQRSKEMPINYGIIVTVNNFNVWYLPEIVQYFEKYKKLQALQNHPYYLGVQNILKRLVPTEDYIFLNTMTFPAFYNIQNLPKHIKEQVDKKLMSSPHNAKFRQIVDFMWLENNDPEQFDKFITWTNRQDLYRKQKFSNTFPEFSELIDRHSNFAL